MGKKPFEQNTDQSQNQEQRENYESIKESYQPTEDTLDNDNPPGGGSGVPEKED